eukprot:15864927-Heterocapsa_arctica.AAC.1
MDTGLATSKSNNVLAILSFSYGDIRPVIFCPKPIERRKKGDASVLGSLSLRDEAGGEGMYLPGPLSGGLDQFEEGRHH